MVAALCFETLGVAEALGLLAQHGAVKRRAMGLGWAWGLGVGLAMGCADPAPPAGDGGADGGVDAGGPGDDVPTGPAVGVFDPGADLTQREHFYDMPYPSDLRLTAEGTPDLRGFPHRGTLLPGVVESARERRGFPVIPVGYFRFTAPLAMHDATTAVSPTADAPAMLIDVDPASPERGRRVPVLLATPPEDAYLPGNAVAIAARPGFVLRGGRRYAFVLRDTLRDARGGAAQAAPVFAQLRDGTLPDTAPLASALRTRYAPLWETLAQLSIARSSVIAATVFTTGDAVADTAALGDRVLARFDVTLDGLDLAPGDSPSTHPRFCHLQGRMTMPQFQRGSPPFSTEGTFALDADGVPVPQTYAMRPGYASVPFSITLPRAAMPAEGYPLVLYLHGSGGLSTQAVDRGTWRPQGPQNPCPQGTDSWLNVPGCNTLGQGPAHLLAHRGFATAASALPVNPERLPGASGTEYLNLSNLRAFRDTFRQGVLEQRLYIEALERLRIPAALVARCTGASLPSGVSEGRLDLRRLIAMGQSMGGMYTNMVAATEPRIKAAIPTGAGGYWGYFILQTQLVPGAAVALRPLIGTNATLTFMHPALAMLETAWEPAEPLVYMPRVAHDPLADHPVRPIYEPVGEGDSYFPTVVFDAVALAYRHPQVGASVWPSMQAALGLGELAGLRSYPLSNNLQSARGSAPYTGAVVQYAGDGVYDPHAIYTQLDAVKYQYGCFAQSFQRTGVAQIVDPAGRQADSACP